MSGSVAQEATALPTDTAVSVRGLRKVYRSRRGRAVAVDNLDLDVPAGGVHGFLGPNGSGKTTSIRMLLGLIRADAGTMSIFGQPVPQRLPDVINDVGAIVESPKFFPAFSGRRNLELLAQAIGTPRTRVDEVLEETGLRDRGKDAFSSYSLGMKQRLAIAGTLLKDPKLLIFDEPTNGLDPAGIREVRQTMRWLGDQGKTVLVSSHILAEVQQVADTVTIIGRGTRLASGKVSEVVGGMGPDARVPVRIGIADAPGAAAVLMGHGFRVRDDHGYLVVEDVTDPAELTRLLAEQNRFVGELVPLRPDLESAFLELTQGHSLPAAGGTGLYGHPNEPSGGPSGPAPGHAPAPPGAPAPGGTGTPGNSGWGKEDRS